MDEHIKLPIQNGEKIINIQKYNLGNNNDDNENCN